MITEDWDKWIAGIPNQHTRSMYLLAWKHLAPLLPDNPTLSDLPPALLRLRQAMRDTGPAFNRTRASIQSFIKHQVGTKHSVYKALDGIEKHKENRKRRNGLPIDRVIEIRESLPEKAGKAWWTLFTTGMRIGEYDGENGASWKVDGDLVDIRGTKSQNAERVIPRLGKPERREIGLKQFRAALRKQGVSPHIARYSFKSMAEDAGIPENRVEQYMGRSGRGMSGLYSQVELRDWVAKDRVQLLEYLALAEQDAKRELKFSLRTA